MKRFSFLGAPQGPLWKRNEPRFCFSVLTRARVFSLEEREWALPSSLPIDINIKITVQFAPFSVNEMTRSLSLAS